MDSNEADGRPWKIRSSHYLIDQPHLRIRSDEIELPDGTIVPEYYVRETRGYSVIFATTTDGRIVLVRQYKHGAGRELLELPAGGIDPGEAAEACAVRELAEETGYVGEPPELIGSFLTDATASNGRFYLYLIRNAEQRVAQKFDVTENITVELVRFEDLLELVRTAAIEVNSHVAAVLYTADAIARGAVRL